MNSWALGFLNGFPNIAEWSAPNWGALASSVTALTAIAAASAAYRQLRLAQQLRREEAQPYVAIFMEPSTVSPHFVDIVIKNFGRTAATNITIGISPEATRSSSTGGNPEPVLYPKHLPALMPGQEWRTFWDFGPSRKEQGIAGSHQAQVEYDGILGAGRARYEYSLSWDFFEQRMWVQEYGVHDAAKALRQMERHMREWREGNGKGIRVILRDGNNLDKQRAEQFEAHQRRLEMLKELGLRPETGSDEDQA